MLTATSMLAVASALAQGTARSPTMQAAAASALVVRMSGSCEGAKYNVYLENDSYNMREYVVRVLIMVCDISDVEASSIVQEANDNWMALCGTWEEDLAEHIYEGMRKKGLSATIQQVDDTSDDDPRPRYLDGSLIENENELPGWYQ